MTPTQSARETSTRSPGRVYSWCVSVGGLAIFFAAYLLGVQSTTGQQAENSLLLASTLTSDVPAPLGWVSMPGILLTTAIIAIAALFLVERFGAVLIIGAIGLTVLCSQLLKNVVIDRPEYHAQNPLNSFPSGHASAVSVLALAVLIILPPAVRWAAAPLAAAGIAVISWQLLAFGWHRPSDILGAFALGTIFLGLCGALRPGIAPRYGSRMLSRTRLGLAVFGAITAVIAVVIAVVGVGSSAGSGESMLLAAELGVVAASALLVAIISGVNISRSRR